MKIHSLIMKHILSFFILIGLANALSAQYVYDIRADSVRLTNPDSTELIIENHTQGVLGFLFNTGNGRTIFKRALIQLDDSTYLLGADTLHTKKTPYWNANGNHIYNTNSGNVGIHRNAPQAMLDLPGSVNIDDSSSYRIHYHSMIRVGDLESNVYTNLFVGDSSGHDNSGHFVTHMGNQAGVNSSGDYSTFYGYMAGYDNEGLDNTFVGTYSGQNNSPDPANPSLGSTDNSFFGFQAGIDNSGAYNTYLGSEAGWSATGSNNSFQGHSAGAANSGNNCSFYGSGSGVNGIGDNNAFYGANSGAFTAGMGDTYLGTNAGNNEIGYWGNYNVFVGDSTATGALLGPGSNNTFIGALAASSISECQKCTLIGAATDINTPGGVINSTAIGFGCKLNTSNAMVFGNANVQNWLFGTSSTVAGSALVVGSNSSNGNGAYLTSGGVWTNASDQFKKENFESLDNTQILDKIGQLPITRWNYKGLSEQHIGPMAQDFYRIFRVGMDDKTISTIDPSGIALAGIQGLYNKIHSQNTEIQDMQARLRIQQTELADRQAKIDQLLERLNKLETVLDSTLSAQKNRKP